MDSSFWQQMLNRHKNNLEKLLAQRAVYAVGEVPLHLLNQIEAEKSEIRKAQIHLGLSEEIVIQQSPNPVTQTQHATLLRLQLLPDGPGHLVVRGLEVPGGGQPRARGALPFDPETLQAVLVALERGLPHLDGLNQTYIDSLQAARLVQKNYLIPEFHQEIGQRLFQTLFQQEILTEYVLARRQSAAIEIQLIFDPEDITLAQHPWELIHDGVCHLLSSRGEVLLTRTITMADPPPLLSFGQPLRVLSIHPRPKDQTALPVGAERDALQKGLGGLVKKGAIQWNLLMPPTWRALENYLNDQSVDILHFDGHGMFARLCPICTKPHASRAAKCKQCSSNLEEISPQGYLLFETDNHFTDAIKAGDLKLLLRYSGLRLGVLTACGSGQVAGISSWNGIAPGLLQAGIPAVVGMQGSPQVTPMVQFVERFYQTLAQGKTIPEATNCGRLAIYRHTPTCWYLPVVYLRSAHPAQ
jgi:hypothetical protein